MPTPPTVTPRFRACGDDWPFALSFVQADEVTPFDISSFVLTADYYVAYRSTYLSRLLVGSGVQIGNPTGGAAQVVVPGALTDHSVTTPQDPWSPADAFIAPAYPTRLVIGLGQGAVHRTVGVVFICPYLAGSVLAPPTDDESPILIPVSPFNASAAAELGSSLDLNIPGNFALE